MVIPAAGSPTVLRLILGRQLEGLRVRAGLSHDQAAEAILASPWTIRRIERAEGGVKLNYVKSLLLAYGVTSQREISSFLDLAREANRPGWWHSYDDALPAWFRIFPGLEDAASLIKGYEPHCVPGLLQTPQYARALHLASAQVNPAPDSDGDADRKVELRIARQQVLTRQEPPHLRLVLEESVLRRPVGCDAIMRAQLTQLIDAAAWPRITLQILLTGIGAHPAMFGMFHVLRFSAPELPDIVYGENLTSAFYLDKQSEVAAYAQAIDRLCALAAPAAKTQAILSDIRKQY